MIFFETKASLRRELESYSTHVKRLSSENGQLRRHLQQALHQLGNTEQFLAVLVGDHVPDTEP